MPQKMCRANKNTYISPSTIAHQAKIHYATYDQPALRSIQPVFYFLHLNPNATIVVLCGTVWCCCCYGCGTVVLLFRCAWFCTIPCRLLHSIYFDSMRMQVGGCRWRLCRRHQFQPKKSRAQQYEHTWNVMMSFYGRKKKNLSLFRTVCCFVSVCKSSLTCFGHDRPNHLHLTHTLTG